MRTEAEIRRRMYETKNTREAFAKESRNSFNNTVIIALMNELYAELEWVLNEPAETKGGEVNVK